jgi:hypothetical protein
MSQGKPPDARPNMSHGGYRTDIVRPQANLPEVPHSPAPVTLADDPLDPTRLRVIITEATSERPRRVLVWPPADDPRLDRLTAHAAADRPRAR